MFSVLELRSQVALWEQYFRDSRAEIENFQSELIWYQVNNPSKDAAIQVEHFQNQLFVQQQKINEMFRQLKLSSRFLLRKDPKAQLDDTYVKAMTVLAENLDMFQKLYNEMKDEFRQVIHVPHD